MKKITFNKISIKNFLSIGETPVVIDFKKGINIITGENDDIPGTKNGIGKSSIIQAFNFAIFGETLVKLNKDQIVNNVTNGKTEVILEFNCNSPRGNNNFKVTRTANPSSLTVLKDGKDKTRDSIPNSTKYLAEVLSASQDIFKNCIIMRANNTIPFLAQGKVEKKKFIESIFNLDIITKMSRLVKDDINAQKRELDIETKLLEKCEENLADYKLKLRDEETRIKSASTYKETKINELNEKIQILKAKIEALPNEELPENYKETLEKHQETLRKGDGIIASLKSKIAWNEQALKAAKNNLTKLNGKSAICPVCQRPFDDETITQLEREKATVSEEIRTLTGEIAKFTELEKKTADKRKVIQKAIAEIDAQVESVNQAKFHRSKYNDMILAHENHIRDINNENLNTDHSGLDIIKGLISTETNTANDKKLFIKETNDVLAQLDIAAFILSDNGIKAYIIKKLLDLLNFRIKYYLAKFNSQYSLEFDQYFEETIKNKKQLPVGYNNLSGAESKMLDLACIWAFRDIMKLQGSVDYNVAFYDEILDSSMDDFNSNKVCKVLNEFTSTDNQCIYLVSHKQDIVKGATGEVIMLRKSGGITSRTDVA